MKIPSTLPVTAEQSRAARFHLGLTQADVIEESGLPGHKLKNFETGRFVPDIPFLDGLRDYYTGKGIDLDQPESGASEESGQRKAGKKPASPGSSIVRPVHRMSFCVSDDLSEEAIEQVLERMGQNDERIAGFLKEPAKAGLLSEYSEETEATLRELFGALAENYLAFRFLQGRNIILPPKKKDKEAVTIADIVGKFFAASPLAAVTAPEKAGKGRQESGEAGSEGGEE